MGVINGLLAESLWSLESFFPACNVRVVALLVQIYAGAPTTKTK